VEYVSPSFLVKKSDGTHRLVTAFNAIASYAKPPPSRPTSTDRVLSFLAGFNYIIKTDMTKQFFQLSMRKSSMQYLGTLTPYKGLRVYTRAAMGMPGSTEHLDELMSRVLGDLMQAQSVMKLADDLYIGGNTIAELLYNWECVLQRFEANNLRLSASKTAICPVTSTILGWVWSAGNIKVSPHKISPLMTASEPTTVKGLRSWLGAYKHLKACLPGYCSLLADLEAATAGKESQCHVKWSDTLSASFRQAQLALKDLKNITIPRPDDKLIITNDGAVKAGGVGSVLYVMRDNNMLLGGFFSAKLKPHQRKWLPCEVEALAISAAVNHWSPYILETKHPVQVLTDSRPCVQAVAKLGRGEFSHSARVSTFLSTLSRFQVSMQYIPGCSNLPADYQSRNPAECSEKSCQVCKFIEDNSDSSVLKLTVSDILDGTGSMPFMSPTAWKISQQDCKDLRRVYAHLFQGTRPGPKACNIRDIKRYLRVCTIGRDGLLIVRWEMPFTTARDLTVIPQRVLNGLISALHLRLQHPSKSQMQKIFHRYFYALDSDNAIGDVTSHCPQCASIAKLPKALEEFTTSPPQALGATSACDILCRARQRIFLIRDCFSSFTITKLIPDERKGTLKAAIIETTASLKPPSGCVVRVDGATALHSLIADRDLQRENITLEPGRLKNRNKNPIAEKGIQELEDELKREYLDGGPVTDSTLALVTATLNMRLCSRGLSAKEIVYQRDNIAGEQLNFVDRHLATSELNQRQANPGPSAWSQARTDRPASHANV
jgi:hypothetical protein